MLALKGMLMNRLPVSGLLLASLALGGCGALAGRADENSSQAWVARVAGADEAARLPAGCGADLSAYPNGQFVQVREPHGRRMVSVIAHVPQGMKVEAGDEVEIAPARCANGVLPEVRQVLGR
jgi:hypothetical protein